MGRTVRIDSGVEQSLDHGGAAVGGRKRKRCNVVAGPSGGIGAGVQQQTRHVHVVALYGPVEGCGTVRVRGIDVRPAQNQSAQGIGGVPFDGVDRIAPLARTRLGPGNAAKGQRHETKKPA